MEMKQKLPCVAIIGAGFSGLISAFNLVLEAKKPLEIMLFDDSPYSGKGVAYSTDCPFHLLNVPADNMGALHSDPEHFYNWLKACPDQWRSQHPDFQNITFHEKSFVPRMIYGRYLKHIGELLEEIACSKGILIHTISERVDDFKETGAGQLLLTTSQNHVQAVDAAILAIGIPWAPKFTENLTSEFHSGFLQNLWPGMTEMEKAREVLKKLNQKSVVAIIGSGLSMLDALATLHMHHYAGRIVVFAGKGLLPQVHLTHRDPTLPHIELRDFPLSALGLLKKIRQLCASTVQAGDHWQSVFQAMRPLTVSIWMQLPLAEKKRVLRHLFGLWNTHRHRSAPEVYGMIDLFTNLGRLKIMKARVVALGSILEGKIDVSYTRPNFEETQLLHVDLVVNCAGPEQNIKKYKSVLIQNLLKRGLAQPDELGLGIAVDANNGVYGNAYRKLFAVGSMLFGTYFETVAVPELRKQCHEVAAGALTRCFGAK